jgi:hypothetical protein
MEINNAFVNGLFLLMGIVLSSAINYFMVKRERKWKESLKDIKMLAKQCESFWHLEQSYLLYIAMKDSNEKMKSVQRKRRSILTINPKLEKIVINPSSINKLLSKWDITNQ